MDHTMMMDAPKRKKPKTEKPKTPPPPLRSPTDKKKKSPSDKPSQERMLTGLTVPSD